MVRELAMSDTHIRAGGQGPAPEKVERGDLQVEVFYGRLIDSLPYLMDLDARYRSRAAVLQFVRCERGDISFLIGSDLIWECTGVKMKADNVHLFVDGVRAVVSDRFYRKAVFLGIRLTPAV
jgi:hypothetical protein